MIDYVLIKYVHVLGIFALVALLTSEHILLKNKMSIEQLKSIARVDLFYGISALVVLLTGLALWLWVGKPASFYSVNLIFQLKFGLFILIGLISIYPTVFFIKSSRIEEGFVEVPGKIISFVRLQLALLLLIPLLAVLMAQGITF